MFLDRKLEEEASLSGSRLHIDELENPPGLQYNVPWAHLFFAEERKALALSYLGLSLSGGFLLSSRNRKRLLWR